MNVPPLPARPPFVTECLRDTLHVFITLQCREKTDDELRAVMAEVGHADPAPETTREDMVHFCAGVATETMLARADVMAREVADCRAQGVPWNTIGSHVDAPTVVGLRTMFRAEGFRGGVAIGQAVFADVQGPADMVRNALQSLCSLPEPLGPFFLVLLYELIRCVRGVPAAEGLLELLHGRHAGPVADPKALLDTLLAPLRTVLEARWTERVVPEVRKLVKRRTQDVMRETDKIVGRAIRDAARKGVS